MFSHRLPHVLLIGMVVAAVLSPIAAQAPAPPFELQKLADGVFASIRTEPIGLGVDANNLFIIDDDGVVVVDTNFGPSSTRQCSRHCERSPTSQWRSSSIPIRMTTTCLENQVYRDAFPEAEFIAHPFVKEYLPGRGATNRKSQVQNLPGFATALKGALSKGTNLTGAPITAEERSGYESDLRMIDAYLKDSPSFSDVLPTGTVDSKLTLTRRQRSIDILHLGCGHTAADLVVHLPQQGIVATGDLVVFPIPLVGGDQSFVSEWSGTLEKLIALKPTIIVPGHGPVMRDTSYVRMVADLFASVTLQVGSAATAGQPLEEVRKTVNLSEFRQRFAGDSQLKRFLFGNYVTGPAVA